jgi:hypothetical protein
MLDSTAFHILEADAPVGIVDVVHVKHPAIEPLSNEVLQDVQAITRGDSSSAPPAHDGCGENPMQRLSNLCTQVKRLGKGLPLADQLSIVVQMEEVVAGVKAKRQAVALPDTTKAILSQDTRHWNRQVSDIRARALFKARSRKAVLSTAARASALAVKRAANAARALPPVIGRVGDSTKEGASSSAAVLPRVQPAGRPRQKVVGIAGGGNWQRGGRSYGIKPSKAKRGAVKGDPAVQGGVQKGRKGSRRKGQKANPASLGEK